MSLVALVKTQGIKNLVWIIHITMQEVYDIQIFPLFFKKPVKKVEAGYWVSRMVLIAKLFDRRVKNQIQNFLHGDRDD